MKDQARRLVIVTPEDNCRHREEVALHVSPNFLKTMCRMHIYVK